MVMWFFAFLISELLREHVSKSTIHFLYVYLVIIDNLQKVIIMFSWYSVF